MNDDAALLRRYAGEKSEAAFAELVHRHFDLVYSAAFRRLSGDAHAAADIAQQVFTTLARDAQELSLHAVLTAWLYTATRHAAIDLIRSEQRRHARELEASTMQNLFAATPDADWERLRPVLDHVMDELSDADRTAVLLRFFEKRAFAEVGATLNLSEDAARMRVDRALEKLRVLLERRGVTSTAAALTTALANQVIVAAPAGLAASITGIAVTTGAATATTGFFMSTTNLITGAVAVIAMGAAVFQVNQTHRAEAELAALARDRDSLRAQLRDVEQRTAAAERQNAALQRDLVAARAAKAAAEIAARPSSPAGVTALTAGPNGGGTLTFRASPAPSDPVEARRLIREMNLEGMDTTYRAFYRRAGLTPAQIEQFKTLMTDYYDRRETSTRTAMNAAMAQSPRPDRAALQAVFDANNKQAYDEWLATIGSNFGAAALQTFQHFGDIIAAGEVTKMLSNALFYTDTPLTVAQADQLMEIVAANSRNSQGKVDLATMNTDAILTQAQSILSAPQFIALRRAQFEVRLKFTPTATKPPGG